MHAYARWREQLIEAIEQYRAWLNKYKLDDPQVNDQILSTLESLHTDRITLAFAAEFSRGKTELINSMFFSETGVRLLPSTPGRTTMCPTEILYDHKEGSYIRLLSIDSRLTDMTLTEYKQHPDSWMHLELDSSSPVEMQKSFQELVAVKTVSLENAKELGLYHEDMYSGQSSPPETIEVPCWRHALISFPHPLLKEGLCILDTPGLNALGTEPELTLTMLPNAQAVIFVLAADTGVTQSDRDMWRNHVRGFRSSQKNGLAVVLNKIDSMWDDLAGEQDIEDSIRSQIQTTASILDIDENLIFPVSAKQALLAKVKGDEALLEKSRLQKLEDYLSNGVLGERQKLVVDSVTKQIGHFVDESSGLVESRLSDIEKQLSELRSLGGENKEMAGNLMTSTRDEQSRYLSNVENFQASRRVFMVQARILIDELSPEKINEIIRRNKKEMAGSLTTVGMKSAMKMILDELRMRLQGAVDATDDTRRLVKAIYKKFEDDHDFDTIKPVLFAIKSHQFELEQLFDEGESFRNSASSTLMEQRLVSPAALLLVS